PSREDPVSKHPCVSRACAPAPRRQSASAVPLILGLLLLAGCAAGAAPPASAPAAPAPSAPSAAASSASAPASATAPPAQRLALTVAYSSLVASQSPTWIAQE